MNRNKRYSYAFLVPAGTVFLIFFIVPTVISFYYSMTVWNFDSASFCGLDNYKMIFSEDYLSRGLKNTLVYAVLTSVSKVVLAFLIALFLTSKIKTKNVLRSIVFFPNLVSAIAVGATFKALMHPTKGFINNILGMIGIDNINWLGNPDAALYSIAAVDIWKGISISLIIYIAGIQSIDRNFYEAAEIDGASYWQKLRYITIPMTASSRNTIILLSFIGGIRSFDLIWSMTGGGPGFATDVMASIVYKQYVSGYYGISTAGSVIMLLLIALLVFPLQKFLNKREEQLQ